MSGEIDAAGDLAAGALLARAVEPEAGGTGAVGTSGCLNCGAALDGRFCAQCGQAATVHRTLRAFWNDFLHSILHFDGKFWRTLPLLIWKPGELTRRYIHGERAKFVSPLALFLFSIFLLFASVSLPGDGGTISPDAKISGVSVDPQSVRGAMKAEVAKARVEVERIEAEISRQGSTPALQQQLANARSEAAVVENLGLVGGGDFRFGEWEGLNKQVKAALDNPALLAYKLQTNAYKFSWALIPLSLPFLWLMFAWRRQFKIYDHAIFVTYSLCFMSLLVVMLALASGIPSISGPIVAIGVLYVPVHMYRQLKGAYALNSGSAAWRTAALSVSATIVVGIAAILLLIQGVSG